MNATSDRFRCSETMTDGELVIRCRSGDERAWATLVMRHARRLRAIAGAQGLDPAAAEDAAQATWSRLWCSIDDIEQVDAIGGWLSTVVRREAIRISMRQRRTQVLHEREADDSLVEEGILLDERVQALRRAFGRLRTSDQRLLGLLFDSEDRSYVDIAALAGCPVGSIGPTRARALRRLARVMKEAA